MKTIGTIIYLMLFCIATSAQTKNSNQTLKPHRYEIPCDNKTVFTVKFDEPHNHIEVILMKNDFIVDLDNVLINNINVKIPSEFSYPADIRTDTFMSI